MNSPREDPEDRYTRIYSTIYIYNTDETYDLLLDRPESRGGMPQVPSSLTGDLVGEGKAYTVSARHSCTDDEARRHHITV